MKMLFVSQRIHNRTSGARIVSTTNLAVAKKCLGAENVDVYSIQKEKKSKFSNILNKLFLRLDGLTKKDVETILSVLSAGQYDAVYLDSSYFGLLAGAIHRLFPKMRIITFYHDILIHWWKETHECSLIPYWMNYFQYYRSERKCAFVSELNIVMTRRDSDLLVEKYAVSPEKIRMLPLSIDIQCRPPKAFSIASTNATLLFIGVDYKPNIDGIEWFLSNVQPFITVKTVIVGKGLEKFRTKWEAERVTVEGTVDDIQSCYMSAAAVIIPLFSGSGMKVKTAEAMSFGKPVFSTDEGLTGYSVDAIPGIYRCNTAGEFISAIQAWGKESDVKTYHSEIQRLFEDNYSLDAAVKAFSKAVRP